MATRPVGRNWQERLNISADPIASKYGLSLADVCAARVSYYCYREEVDRAIAKGEELVSESGAPLSLSNNQLQARPNIFVYFFDAALTAHVHIARHLRRELTSAAGHCEVMVCWP
ncbi:MAG: hypothetical protein Q8R28_08955 [Dehalococcoidia bacterium]|nr:hypothetical protein [Dehalococcoidia bacterium]